MSSPYLPGKFVWFEFLTQDIDRAIEFYDGRAVPVGQPRGEVDVAALRGGARLRRHGDEGGGLRR